MDNNMKKYSAAAIVLLVLLFGILYLFYQKYQRGLKQEMITNMNEEKASIIYRESSLSGNPEYVQNLFVDKIKKGENDKYAKFAAYWVAHRFFDNGADINEIYKYVKNHPELSFLNEEAGKIFPNNFQFMATGKVQPATFEAMFLQHAYLEVIDNYGYADGATLTTLANKYAEVASYCPTLLAKYPEGSERNPRIKEGCDVAKDKAILYFNKSTPFIDNIMSTTISNISNLDMDPHNTLVTLNQYNAAHSFLTKMKIDHKMNHTSDEIFVYSLKLSEQKVPILYTFTSYLHAYAKLVDGSSTSSTLFDELLTPVTAYSYMNSSADASKMPSMFRKILVSKNETADNNPWFGMYAHNNINELATLSPKFKTWLIQFGWEEKDFHEIK